MNFNLKAIFVILFVTGSLMQTIAQPGYAGEWKKTRLYGHSYDGGGFTDKEYDWIRDHFEYFCVEKTHLNGVYGNPSHELTSRITAKKILEANPRCKPLMIYSLGGGYTKFFESHAEIIKTNPEYFLYNDDGSVASLNPANSGENDWYIETINKNVDNSDLAGIFYDSYKGVYLSYPKNLQYIMKGVHGFRLGNGMDFVPNGTSIRDWPESIEYCDGTFIDAFFRRRVLTKEAGVVLIDACIAIPKDHMFVCFSAYDGYSTTFEFSHAAYLIVAHENTYYRWVDAGDNLWSSESLMTWHDVWDKEMGAPLGKAVKNGYVYTRVFRYCTVTLDVANITSNIVWGQNNGVGVTSVSISATNKSLSVGETSAFTATVLPMTASNKSVIWTSSNTSVATVSSTGVVNAVAAGTATITVQTQDGNITDTCAVTVTVPVTSVSVLLDPQTSDNNAVFTVYPNPVNDQLVIELSNAQEATYAIINNAGQPLQSGGINGSSVSVDVDSLASGIYLVKVSSNHEIYFRKIIKK